MEQKQTMKKFNLKAALDGAKVVTGDGEEVLGLVEVVGAERYPLAGSLNGVVKSWSLDGAYTHDDVSCPMDLFMATEVKTYYVGVYKNHGHPLTGDVFTGDTSPNEQDIHTDNPDWIKTISFEIEE